MSGAPVAIVRMAAQCALGASLAECVERLRDGDDGIRIADALEQSPRNHAGIGQVPEAATGSRTLAATSDRAERLLAGTLDQLLEGEVLEAPGAAGVAGAAGADPARTAIILGTTIGGMRHCGAALRLEAAGDEARADREFACVPAGAVLRAAVHGHAITGPALTLSCACASALSAVVHGCAFLRSGAADLVIAGGYDPISEFCYGGFAALQLVAEGPLSPFARDREGMKLGEGCALLLLCTLQHARARNLDVIAVVERTGEASDAFHLTQPHPEGRGAAEALLAATGGDAPDLLLAHATGTPGNDSAEYAAYCRVFGGRLGAVPVTALKSRIGHPLGAAGAAELVLGLAAARAGFAPAGLGRAPDRDAHPALDLIHGNTRSIAPTRITALAAGFGGANVAVTVSRVAPARGMSEEPAVASCGILVRAAGAICAGGLGVEGLRALASAGPPPAATMDAIMAPLLDAGKTRRMALLPRMMLAAVRELCDSSHLDPAWLEGIPLIAATWHGAANFTELYYRDLLASGIDLANPVLFAESVPNVGSAHVSLAFGTRAASATVIGARTAGVQALSLAVSRIRAGEWERVLVIAADEGHPLVARVLSKRLRRPVEPCCGAVALLLERSDGEHGLAIERAEPAPEDGSGTRPTDTGITSASACDDALRARGYRSTGLPELGCAGALGTLMLAGAMADRDRAICACSDPCGREWEIVVRLR